MRKLWILTILFAFIMAGCGANPNGYTSTVSSEESTTAAETTTTTAEQTTTAEPTTDTTSKAVRKIQAVATTTEATELEDRIIALDKESKRGGGTLTFKSVKLHGNLPLALFSYETTDKDASIPCETQSYCIGKSGKKYKADGMGGTGNKGFIGFGNVTDFSDLSTCTITYVFEGYDPVTVTIDIPGV